jgi:hypothetical protein
MDARTEADRLARLFDGRPEALLTLLAHQLAVVKTEAQVLTGLCSLAVTVTGFSGAHMIRSGSAAAWCMVLGIAFVLAGATLCLRVLTWLRWVTQDLQDDLGETARVVLQRRNRQQRSVRLAGTLVICGLALYLAAVVIAAIGADVR